MKIIRLAVMANLIFAFIMGCSGNYGKIHTQSESDAKATQKELLNNWTEYNVYINRSRSVVRLGGPFEAGAIVFDPKNDDRKILVGRWWDTVKDQQAWAEIVKANTTSAGDFDINPLGSTRVIYSTGVREIWGPDNQLYGFIICLGGDQVIVKKIDEKSIRISRSSGYGGGAP